MKKLLLSLRNQKGITLVEVIVTFTLTTVLMTAAAMTLTAFSNVYLEVNHLVRAQSVSGTVSDEIFGQLYLASSITEIGENETFNAQGNVITFINPSHSTVDMYSDGEKLIVHYREERDNGKLIHGEINWFYPLKAYMYNKLTSLTFKRLSNSPVIQLDIELTDMLTGKVYSYQSFVECANLDFTVEEP